MPGVVRKAKRSYRFPGDSNQRKETDMAIKPTKLALKKPSRKVRDLATRKDPRGGAQKKETPVGKTSTRGGMPLRPGKTVLS
jgi:hypothetical protein